MIKNIGLQNQSRSTTLHHGFIYDNPYHGQNVYTRVIHEKFNFKRLTSSSIILFIIVIKYIMQNFSNFEKKV